MELIKKRCQKFQVRRYSLRFAFMIVATCVVTNAFSADDIVVVGRKTSWDGRLASGWIGGNSSQIETIIASTTNVTLRQIMREMLLDAQALDVYFTHLDVTGTTSQTLSTIRVNTIPSDFQLGNMAQAKRRAFWQSYAKLLEADGGPGSSTSLVEDGEMSTGGYTAFQAVFETILPGGGKMFKVTHIVAINSNLTHMFELKADTQKIRARYEEFQNLLMSVRYR